VARTACCFPLRGVVCLAIIVAAMMAAPPPRAPTRRLGRVGMNPPLDSQSEADAGRPAVASGRKGPVLYDAMSSTVHVVSIVRPCGFWPCGRAGVGVGTLFVGEHPIPPLLGGTQGEAAELDASAVAVVHPAASLQQLTELMDRRAGILLIRTSHVWCDVPLFSVRPTGQAPPPRCAPPAPHEQQTPQRPPPRYAHLR